jgi:UDP-N-acetylmuramyl pentapeptide phosphotransferase/UDP-N-acetylglucosamine-1-phosphate transferase
MEILSDPGMFLALFAVSFGICGAIVLARPWLVRNLRAAEDLLSIQCAHLRHTPRIGGLGVLVAAVAGMLVLVPEHPGLPFGLFALTLVPVFLAGIAEDLGWRVSARGRLIAAATSAALAVGLLGVWIPPLGIPGLDALLAMAPLAIVVTVLWATGVCHALNLIDGVNGLAGGTALLIAAGIALVAQEAGVSAIAMVAAGVGAAVLGFLVFNWPLGRIFLGDAGAYSLGHVLVWLAIGLAWISPEVSALSLSLMFFWPVADTILAITRRLHNGRSVSAPDRLHYHQFVMRALILLSGGRLGKGIANSATGLLILPLVAAPIATAVHFWDRPMAALLAWGVFGLLFTLSYLGGLRLFRSNLWRGIPRARRAANAQLVPVPAVLRKF